MPPKSFLALSRVLAMLSFDNKVNEGALNEKRLLNHDRLGEMLDPAELGPDNEGENGIGSMLRSFKKSVDAVANLAGGMTGLTLLSPVLEHTESVLTT